MSRLPHAQRIAEWLLLLFVAFAVLWRGGKSVDATFLLGIITIIVLFCPVWFPVLRKLGFPSTDNRSHGITVPLGIWGVLLAFIAWSILSYLASATRTYGLDELVRDTSCVLLFLWVVRRAGNRRVSVLLEGFLWALTIAGCVAVLFGLAVYVFQPVNRFVGTFLDWRFHTDYWPNAWAEFVLLAWPMAALLASRNVGPIKRWFCVGVTGLLIGALLLSYSRGGFIAFVGQLACLAGFSGALILRDVRVSKAAAERWRRVCAGAGVAIVVALALFGGANLLRGQRYDVESVAQKATFRSAEGTSSISERSQFWNQALELSMERPVFGYGPYSFRFAQTHLMQGVLATSDHPHNIFLKLTAERGWAAVVLFLAFLSYVLGLSVRHLFLDRKNDWSLGKDAATIALLTGTLGVLAHNLIDYNLQFVGIALPFWLALALLSTHLAEKRPVSRASFSHWRLAKSLTRVEGIFLFLLLAVVAWEGAFLVVSSLGRRAEATGDIPAALTWYERATPEWFSRDLPLAKARLLEGQGLLDESDAAFEAALDENAVDARTWRLRAELALRRGEPAPAERYAAHAYRLGRYTDIGILRVWIDAATKAGDQSGLRARKQEFDALFAAFAEAIARNTHHIALSGNVEELQVVAGQLSRLFPTDAERYLDIASDAYAHAETERAGFSARPAGLLW